MKSRAYFLHALSPLHAGTGQSVDVIDLPIARMRATGIPIVPGSSVRGVLRDHRRPPAAAPDVERGRFLAVFGPEPQKSDEEGHAGALIVSDARLLALPVRSFRGTFAWVTSPWLLELARRDLAGDLPKVPEISGRAAVVIEPDGEVREAVNVHSLGKERLVVYLEDLDLPAAPSPLVNAWGKALATALALTESLHFRRRLVVVDDETMTFLFETATQVDTRVRIDSARRTVAEGALWVEESLPPDTLLIGLLEADRSRRPGIDLSPTDVLDAALGRPAYLQFGGKATVGRGRCRIVPVESPAREG
ncbi:type III-B CRISPR module RAMP protein Cmr4 [Myxococcota bacterium]|nr:type III-B CRISPR module RAMP protein Cmr4 [Myxococcota bacterium]